MTAQVVRRHSISRIGLRPEFIGLARFFQVAGDKVIVVRLDVELLPLAHALAQFVGLPRVLRCQGWFPRDCDSSSRARHRPWRNSGRGGWPAGTRARRRHSRLSHQGLPSQAVGLQGFERGRGGLLEWRIEFLHRAQRFAQLVAQFPRLPCPRASSTWFFAARLRLLVLARDSPVAQFTALRSERTGCPSWQSNRSRTPCSPRAGRVRGQFPA